MTVVLYLLFVGICLAAGALVAHYSEKIRQMEEELKGQENAKRQLMQELDVAKRRASRLERSVEQLQDEKEKAELQARELQIERDTIRRFMRQSMSPRPAHASTPINLRAVHA